MSDHKRMTLTGPRDPALAELLPDRIADAGGPGDGLTLVRPDPETTEVTWYDTRDSRLAAWGSCVLHRPGHGWTVLLPAADGRTVQRHVRGRDATPPEGVSSLVAAFARGQPLEPAGSANVTRHTLQLRGPGRGAATATVADDQLHLDGQPAHPVRLVEVATSPTAAPELREWLLGQLTRAGLQPQDPATAARLLRPQAPAPPPELTVPAIGPDADTAALLRNLLATWTLELVRYDPDIRTGHEDEPVHQARVAARRLRWILRAFGPFVDDGWAQRLRDDLKWLDERQAAVRDLDIARMRLEDLAASLPDPDDAAAAWRLAAATTRQRATAHTRLLAAMGERRYVTLLEQLIDAAHAPRVSPRGQEPATRAAAEVVATSWRRLKRAARRTGPDAPDDQLHQLRRRARQARYTAEAVVGVAGKPAARFARAARRLQEELGEQHDAVISQERLHALALGKGRRLREALAAGQLLAAERQAAARHAAAWPARWKKLDRAKLRAWFAKA